MKKARILFGAFFLALGLLTSCSGTPGKANEKGIESTDMVPDSGKTASDKMAAEPTAPFDGITQLLQGKWQHAEDKTNYLVFEGNHRRETAGAMTNGIRKPLFYRIDV